MRHVFCSDFLETTEVVTLTEGEHDSLCILFYWSLDKAVKKAALDCQEPPDHVMFF